MISEGSGGFLSILGSLTIHFAMLIMQIATVRAPKDDEGNYELGTIRIYHAIWIIHLIVCATLLANHYHAQVLGAKKHTINICVALSYTIIFIYIGVHWVFPNEFDPDVIEPV